MQIHEHHLFVEISLPGSKMNDALRGWALFESPSFEFQKAAHHRDEPGTGARMSRIGPWKSTSKTFQKPFWVAFANPKIIAILQFQDVSKIR